MAVLEEWRDVVGYEGLYEVSSLGRVRNSKGLIMKQQKYHNGYMHLSMYRDGTKKNPAVHRVVWEAFNGPIPSGMQIDHVNTIRDDNRIDNLRAVSPSENHRNSLTRVHHLEASRRLAKDPKWRQKNRETVKKLAKDPKWRQKNREARRSRTKAVLQIDPNTGEVIREWECMADIERELGIGHGNISACCHGKRFKTAGGYRWCFCLDNAS